MSKVKRFSTSLVWYHRSEEMPKDGHRILVLSQMYDKKDPFRVRVIDSQFYKLAKDAEYWAHINEPDL